MDPDESLSKNKQDFIEEIDFSRKWLSNIFTCMLQLLNNGEVTEFVDLLHYCIEKVGENGVGQIQLLFDQHPHINFNVQDPDGNTSLHIAGRKNDSQVLNFLLQQPGIDNNVGIKNIQATAYTNSNSSKSNICTEETVSEYLSKLHDFLKSNKITKFVEILNDSNCGSECLKQLCSDNAEIFNDANRNLCLCVAIERNATQAIDVLLQQPEFEVNANMCICMDDDSAMSLTADNGTPIMLAAAKGNYIMLHKLLENADVQSFKPVYWRNVLDQLIDGMSHCKDENNIKMTTSKDCDYFECLKCLLETLSDYRQISGKNVLDDYEMMQVYITILHGNPTCVALMTLLMNSWEHHSFQKFRENLQHLIGSFEKTKQYLYIKDVDGNTALQVAIQKNNKAIVEFIQSHIQRTVFLKVIQTLSTSYGCQVTSGEHTENSYYEMFLMLKTRVKEDFDYLNLPKVSGDTVLDYVVAIGCIKSVVLLTLLNLKLTKNHELFQQNLQHLLMKVDSKNIDANTTDVKGNTALHVAVQENYTNALDFLLKQDEININACNKFGDTPIMIAVEKGYHNTLYKLLNNKEISLKPSTSNKTVLHSLFQGMLSLDNQQPANFPEQDHLKCMELIFNKLPDNIKHPNQFAKLVNFNQQTELNLILKQNLNTQHEHMKFVQLLMLLNPDPEEFSDEKFKKNSQFLFGDHKYGKVDANTKNLHGDTGLHIATRLNQTNIVQFLLNHDEIDINISNKNGDTPLMLAIIKGYHNVVCQLLNHERISLESDTSKKTTILHLLMKAMQSSNLQENDPGCDFHKCLKYILEKLPNITQKPYKFMNSLDQDEKTALNYAVEMKDEEAILSLLHAGSNLHHKTETGDVILREISPEILSKYLDCCISLDKTAQKISQHQLILDCEIFNVPDRKSAETLMQFLLSINNKQIPTLRSILTHPIIDAYFSYQWHDKQIHYWCNVVIYVMFCLALNLYLITLNGYQDLSNIIVWVFLTVLLMVLFLRELFQLVMSGLKYFKSSENLVELLLIGVTSHLLITNNQNPNFNAPVIAISLSFCELMLLIGRHPKLSINTEIFKAVTCNFLKLLLQYFTIILAYAFCFYTVNNQNQNKQTNTNLTTNLNDSEPMNQNHTTFFEIAKSTIDGFVMLVNPVNEPDSNADNLNMTHILFVLGIFFLTMVLGNLLSGLAVNEIQEIRTNAKRFGIISRMKFLWYVDRAPGKHAILKFIRIFFGSSCLRQKHRNNQTENIPLTGVEQGNTNKAGNSTQTRNTTSGSFLRRIFQTLQKEMHPFYNGLPNNKIYILPSDGNIALLAAPSNCKSSGNAGKPYSWRIDLDVVQNAMKIIQERENPYIDYKQLLEKQSQKLENMEQKMKLMTEHIVGRK